jgi:hypothetical protein
MNVFQQLQSNVKLKREKITELFEFQSLQTEFEYELALIRLDFRYDDDANWITYQNNLEIFHELLRETDAGIIKIQYQIEFYSNQISNI